MTSPQAHPATPAAPCGPVHPAHGSNRAWVEELSALHADLRDRDPFGCYLAELLLLHLADGEKTGIQAAFTDFPRADAGRTSAQRANGTKDHPSRAHAR